MGPVIRWVQASEATLCRDVGNMCVSPSPEILAIGELFVGRPCARLGRCGGRSGPRQYRRGRRCLLCSRAGARSFFHPMPPKTRAGLGGNDVADRVVPARRAQPDDLRHRGGGARRPPLGRSTRRSANQSAMRPHFTAIMTSSTSCPRRARDQRLTLVLRRRRPRSSVPLRSSASGSRRPPGTVDLGPAPPVGLRGGPIHRAGS